MRLYELLADWSNWAWPLLANHLWQATLFSLFALAAATTLRRAPAGARYFVWLIALMKFALPSTVFAFLPTKAGIDLSALMRPDVHAAPGTLDFAPILSPVTTPSTVLQAAEPAAHGAGLAAVSFAAATREAGYLYGVLTCLWSVGCLLLLVSWWRRRRRLSAALSKGRAVCAGREADALRRVQTWFGLRQAVRLVITPAIAEPGIWRIWRPVLVLPEGVAEQLDDAELEAVFMHELSHVERWDNLVGTIQRALCCLFWFHPVIWLIDRRLLAEREQACDDTVVRLGGSSEVYAKGITKVCRYCLGWEVAGLSRAAGSDLRKRIDRILSDCAGKRLSLLQLAVVGITAAGALAFSVVTAKVKGGEFDQGIMADRVAAIDRRFDVREPAQSTGRLAAVKQAKEHALSKPAGENNPGHPDKELTSSAAQTEKATPPLITVGAKTDSTVNPPSTVNPRSPENARAMSNGDVVWSEEDESSPPAEPPSADADRIRPVIVKASVADYGDLRKFIGRYEIDPQQVENFVLDITLERGELWLKPSHAMKRRLIRQSATDFSDTYSNFQFTCIMDGRDQVIALRLNSWGRNVTARKLVLPPPSLKGNVTFRLRGYADAKVVAVAGSFNNWNQSQLLFAREGDEWVCRINLPRGTHQYKFIIDGNWLTDPSNPKIIHDERGIENSLMRTE